MGQAKLSINYVLSEGHIELIRAADVAVGHNAGEAGGDRGAGGAGGAREHSSIDK